MALKTTIERLQALIITLAKDLGKVVRGNLSAAQRVRVATIRFQKLGKLFRKESVAAEKKRKKRRKKTR
jgi:hypothetical protein